MAQLKTYNQTPIIADVLHKAIMESGCVVNFTGLLINGNDIIVLGESLTDEPALNQIFLDHTGIDLLTDEINLYVNKRQMDGRKAFFELMAELRLNSIENELPRAVNKFIERKLKFVRDEVILGQWISAKEYLDEVTVESYLTQELWDRINLKLTTYISENY